MSCFSINSKDVVITIPRLIELDSVTYYEIMIKSGPNYAWTVKHRFKDFVELHEILVSERGVSIILPPKKVIGNKSPSFLKTRQNALEKYLKDLYIFLQVTMPKEFTDFLDFGKYDVIFILQNLASSIFTYGESYLAKSKNYNFCILELHAISERLKLPCPPTETNDKKYYFSHILDFCSELDSLTIVPTKIGVPGLSYDEFIDPYSDYNLLLNKPIGTSNIIPVKLKFDLSAFKNLRYLKVYGINMDNVTQTGNLRECLEKITVNKTNTINLNQIILCDDIHKTESLDESKIWKKITKANFSDNRIKAIDTSINLYPKIEELVLDMNFIETIQNLNRLHSLSTLSLCGNRITSCVDWHLELGNLVSLNLSQNKIKQLSGLDKMYSLVSLDLSCNQIEDLDEVDHIGDLPCLENLRLTGNPIAGSVDYRARVLSRFGDRLQEILLDNEKGDQVELDTALVLSALRISHNITSQISKDSIKKNVFCTIKR